MKNMTLENIAKACSGKYYGPEERKDISVSGVTIDSRKVEEGFLFIALKGERVDGHSFLSQAFQGKAACSMVEELPEDLSRPYILVESCHQALKDAAEFYRRQLLITVVGITGSVGKTSTKEMIASVLKEKYCVLKTEGNFNNEIGLPLTIFNLREEHQVAVIEMGISDFGEMHRLAKVARPDICVITNIGLCHLENLKDQEGILRAKTEIFDFLDSTGRIILNGDDPLLQTVKEVKGISPVFFGKEKRNKVYADHIVNKGLKGTACRLNEEDSCIEVLIPIPGEHMVYNALAAFAVGKALGLKDEEIQTGIEGVAFSRGRSNLIELKDVTVIDDCYNANPVSMKAAIDMLDTAEGRKVAILGDMGELGENEAGLHYQVGQHIAEKSMDQVICIGTLAAHIEQGIHSKNKSMSVHSYLKKEEALRGLKDLLKKGDTILVKASHSMGFDEIVEFLKNE